MNHDPSHASDTSGPSPCSGPAGFCTADDARPEPSLTGHFMEQLPCPVPAKEKRAEWAIMFLYLFFFGLWALGLAIGVSGSGGQILLWGLPLWFGISCTISYVAACVALIWVVRRYFQ